MTMKYNIECNDGRTIFYGKNDKKVISMDITDWTLESVVELSRIFSLR